MAGPMTRIALPEAARSPRILIVRLSAIGDTVHTLPALALIRGAHPQAFIGWAVEDFATAFLETRDDLDQLHVIPKKRWRSRWWSLMGSEIIPWVAGLRACRYDIAMDFQGLTKSGVVARLSGARRRIGFGDAQGAELNKLFTNERIVPPPGARHIVERNAALLAALGIEEKPAPPEIVLTGDDERRASQILAELGLADGRAAAGLNIGAGWETKRWPAAHWAALAGLLRDRAGLRSVLLWGSEAERMRAEEIKTLAAARGIETLIPPTTTLRENAAFMSRLRIYIGGDTAATHVAAAMGVPTVGLYGASDSIRNGPYGPRATALQVRTVPCIPCWKQRCSYERPLACLVDLTPETVRDAAEKLLEG